MQITLSKYNINLIRVQLNVFCYRKEANDLLAKASEVNDALNKTDEAQKDAKEAINNVLNDVKAVNELISTVRFPLHYASIFIILNFF